MGTYCDHLKKCQSNKTTTRTDDNNNVKKIDIKTEKKDFTLVNKEGRKKLKANKKPKINSQQSGKATGSNIKQHSLKPLGKLSKKQKKNARMKLSSPNLTSGN